MGDGCASPGPAVDGRPVDRVAHESQTPHHQLGSAPRTATQTGPGPEPGPGPGPGPELHEEDYLELFLLADQDPASERSADCGFVAGVACLAAGVSLVAVSYAVPRGHAAAAGSADVDGADGGVTAREMETLERERARLGAHLDRCVMAGLCLLTLGGAVLAVLLTVSMWTWESVRRKAYAYSKHAARGYGSVHLRPGPGPSPGPSRGVALSPPPPGTDLEALR
ncbi:unnamed protein product [Merluccius merluccius]